MATTVTNATQTNPLTVAELLLNTPSRSAGRGTFSQFQIALANATGPAGLSLTSVTTADAAAEVLQDDLLTPLNLTELANQLAGLAILAQPLTQLPVSQLLTNGSAGGFNPGLFQNQQSTNAIPPGGVTGTNTNEASINRMELLRLQQPAQQLGTILPSPQSQRVPNTNATLTNQVIPSQVVSEAVSSPSGLQPQTATGTALTTPANRSPAIPAQVPLISGLLVSPALASQLTSAPDLPAPIVTSASAGLPGTEVGDRPLMAGEKFAAIASAGVRLTTAAHSVSLGFHNLLDGVLTNKQSQESLSANTTVGVPSSLQAGTPTTASSGSLSPSAFGSAVPASAAHFTDEIITQARLLKRDGSVEFELQLDPPELGRVRLLLVSNGEELRGRVIVADDAVRRMIENQLPELRQRFETAGMNLQQFDVTAEGNGSNRYTPLLAEEGLTAVIRPTLQHRQSVAPPSSANSIDVTV
jgi:hypothetical protein